MSYSIFFFALNAQQVAERFRSESAALGESLAQQLRARGVCNQEEIDETLARAAALCEGKLSENCDGEDFQVLCWLAGIVAEPIAIGSYIDAHWTFLHETDVWPLLARSHPPFPVPVCSSPPPKVGFLSAQDAERYCLPAIERLPASDTPDVMYAREEFRDVVESLVQDGLDLLGVWL